MDIREARVADYVALQDIERAAGRAFAELEMFDVANDEPFTLAELDECSSGGRLWVAVDVDDRPLGYIIVERIDGNTHIEQVSVHPDHARHGIGRALIDHVVAQALENGDDAVTLTAFSDVPWNAPYYRRLGFRTLADDTVTPGLRDKRRSEAEEGLDRWPRVCMRRDL